MSAGIAERLDALSEDEFAAAANALAEYEAETDEWMSENPDDEEGYDAFCESLLPELQAETRATEENFSLLMEASCGEWQVIAEAMSNERNRELLVEACAGL